MRGKKRILQLDATVSTSRPDLDSGTHHCSDDLFTEVVPRVIRLIGLTVGCWCAVNLDRPEADPRGGDDFDYAAWCQSDLISLVLVGAGHKDLALPAGLAEDVAEYYSPQTPTAPTGLAFEYRRDESAAGTDGTGQTAAVRIALTFSPPDAAAACNGAITHYFAQVTSAVE